MKIDLSMVNPELLKRAMDTKNNFKLKNLEDAKNKYYFFQKARRLAPPKDIKFEEKWILRSDGTKLRLCIYSPMNQTKKTLPGVLWCHGGGYLFGYPELDKATYSRLINASESIIIVPEYRLSMDNPYPSALEDVYLTLCWMDKWNKTDRNIVGGISSGGGLAVSLTLYARDNNGPKISYLIPFYPMLDYHMQSDSMKNNDSPVWDEKSTKICWQLYLRNIKGKIPSYASPLEEKDFSNMPPVSTFVGTLDPFYDETVLFVNKLKEKNIKVNLRVFKGCFHGFELEAPRTVVAKEAHEFIISEFDFICKNIY